MAMTLTRGDDSRLDGAPAQDLPNYADMVDRIATAMFSQDPAKYGGEVTNAREDAIAYIKQQEARQQAAAAQRRAEGQQAVAQQAAARQARYGVNPEALPYATSARDIQEANRPRQEAEAALEMEQGLAADIIRGSREGQRNWEAEGDLAYLRERGERNPMAGPGQRDLDVRRRLMEQRGQFYEMPDGTRIPVGRDPTAAEMRGFREFEDWTNETPGSERQALYNPAGYEEFREGVRQDIQDRARQQLVDYGEGPDSNPDLTADQLTNRAARAESENRVYNNPWEVRRRRQRLAMKAGASPAEAAEAIDQQYALEGRPLSFEDRLRMQGDLARAQGQRDRRGLFAQRGVLRGAGLSPAVGDMRNRFDDLIGRLGQEGMNDWQRAGIIAGLTPNAQTANPTPLGVDAVGAQNALRMLNAEALAGHDPSVRGMRELQAAGAEAQLPLPVRADRERDANNGVLPAQSPAGQAVLADIAATTVGGTYTTDFEYNRAVERAVSEGIPRPDAEAYFRRHAQGTNSGFWGSLLGAGQGGVDSAPVAGPAPNPAAGLPPAGGRMPL